uniref:Uncharacterized protein n=1 Tax=Zooxanthella nutricula TaxID=1333877 RepID=A0A7S2K8Y1_9DINO
MRKVRSTSALPSPTGGEDIKTACHPLSTELRRWEGLAATTRRCDMKGMKDVEFEFPPPPKPPADPEPPKGPGRQGLVLFPKYMLINNCHLKTTDLQRFQRQQLEEQRRMAEEAPETSFYSEKDSVTVSERSGPLKFDASWGQPKLKEPSFGGPHWAGAALPAGGSQRHSNPLRMG